jgi:hypothetical protein
MALIGWCLRPSCLERELKLPSCLTTFLGFRGSRKRLFNQFGESRGVAD